MPIPTKFQGLNEVKIEVSSSKFLKVTSNAKLAWHHIVDDRILTTFYLQNTADSGGFHG